MKTIPMKVLVQKSLDLEVSGLSRRETLSPVQIKLKNQSRSELTGRLLSAVSADWRVELPDGADAIRLAPGASTTVTAQIAWQVPASDAKPQQLYFESNGQVIQRVSLIPPAWKIAQSSRDLLAVPLVEWPAPTHLPDWMLGDSSGQGQASVYLAWDATGLLIGLDVKDSIVYTDNPEAFWSLQDVLELMLNSNPETGTTSWDEADRQYWIMPQVEQGDVYLGRWKNKTQATVTQGFDLPVRGVSNTTEDGYQLRMRLPWSEFPGLQPKAGQALGALLRLKIADNAGGRFVYWPYDLDQYRNDPSSWGRLILGD